jgi:hypothetical protein
MSEPETRPTDASVDDFLAAAPANRHVSVHLRERAHRGLADRGLLAAQGGFDGAGELLARLGRHEVSQACIYVKRLSDLDVDVLRELITRAVADVRASRT